MTGPLPTPPPPAFAGLDRLRDAVLVVDAAATVVHANPAACALFATTPAAVRGRAAAALVPGLDADAVARDAVRIVADAAARRLELAIAADAAGATVRIRDVTAEHAEAEARRRRAAVVEATLRASEARLRAAIEVVADGVYEWDVATDRVVASAHGVPLADYPPPAREPSVADWFDAVHPDDAPAARAALARHLAGETPRYEAEYRVRTATGEWRWMSDRAQVVERDAAGRALRLLGANADITERKRAEAALRAIAATAGAQDGPGGLFTELAERLGAVLDLRVACIAAHDHATPGTVAVLARRIDGVEAGPCTVAIAGTPIAEAIATHAVVRADLPPAPARALCGIDEPAHVVIPLWDDREGIVGVIVLAARPLRLDAALESPLLRTVALRATGELVRRRAEARLQERERDLSDAQRIGRMGGYTWRPGHRTVTWTEETYRLFGHGGDGPPVTEPTFFEAVHGEDRERLEAGIAAAFAARAGRWTDTFRIRRADDGAVRWIESQAEIEYDDDGRPAYVRGIHVDVTERRLLEERLRQSQKLEAVGQLASGLAHDFNNLLTVVRGHARFLLQALPADVQLRRDADAIRVASERAAGLARQLLLLGRRDTIAPRRIDPDAVIAGYVELLGRVTGDHVHLVTTLDAGTAAILLDPVHLEQVLLNLALNARDAMADGGALHIETARLAPREVEFPAPLGAVRLRVRDTGVGMPAETAARAFEPFFTTKEPGRGTGIGLATVLGVVEQAGGRIALESAPGVGTTVTIWFPVVEGEAEPLATVAAPAGPETLAKGGTRILVVEDEPDVRDLVARALVDAGFAVVTAHDGIDALERWLAAAGGGVRFDALLSDVRMPRLNGRDLARALRAEDHELPVVLMSGYDDPEALGEAVTMTGAFRFLAKPFGPETLVRTVAGVLRDHATARALAASVDAPRAFGPPVR